MSSEENSEEYGKNEKNDSEVIQNVLSKRNYRSRRVSFPESDTELVTGYLEPVDPLRLAINVNKTELLQAYKSSCLRHNTEPIQSVVDQIKNFTNCEDRIDIFILNKVNLTCYGCESLEEVFKRVQFVNIDLTDCGLTSETAFTLFEMFEYYESAVHLRISNNAHIGVRGWQACSRYLKTSNTLEDLELRNIPVTDNEADCLLKHLSLRHLQVLKLENCNLNGNAMRSLVNALTYNNSLKELYLADNKLGVFEAALLETLLKQNRSLQVLDLSNNQIQDAGLKLIVHGLCSSVIIGCLEMLVLWNNYLTSLCSTYVDNLLRDYRSLIILNVGLNNLHDSFIGDITEALKQNQTIQHLGLQSTNLTCTSAINIAEVLKTNKTIERIDLRENCILFPGAQALSECLDVNKNVIQIDLNETTSGKNSDEYATLVQQIHAKCERNKEKIAADIETSRLISPRGSSRKISLTCQTLRHQQFEISPLLSEPKKPSGKLRSPAPSPSPSPIPSPVSSPIPPPITKSRFSVSRVSETKCVHSRFTVSAVSDPSVPPKSVTTSTGPATVGFDCTSLARPTTPTPTPEPPAASPSPNSVNGCSNEQTDKAAPITEPSSCELIKPPSNESRPMSSIEKLLSIFQAPTHLFTKPTSPSPLTKQCDNVKHLPFSIVNKNVLSSSANVFSDAPNSTSESVKENISPEHSLTLSSAKKVSKYEYNSSCALEIKEVKSGILELSSGGKATLLPLCSSSEDSDSGLATFESCTGSLASGNDSGSVVSDDSAVSFENTASTPSVQSPASESEHSDVTNNNKWRQTTVSVTVTSTDSTTENN